MALGKQSHTSYINHEEKFIRMWKIMCGQLPLAQTHYTEKVLYKMVLFMQHHKGKNGWQLLLTSNMAFLISPMQLR